MFERRGNEMNKQIKTEQSTALADFFETFQRPWDRASLCNIGSQTTLGGIIHQYGAL
tara:strand:- start:1744 stop:1914 length:171 start_codon:yes stop_codon:yes gene_type:complete